jgi:hypothetical protein
LIGKGESRWTGNLIEGKGRKDKKEVSRLEGENVKKKRIKERHKGACRNKKGVGG